jgi:hypothetical protein
MERSGIITYTVLFLSIYSQLIESYRGMLARWGRHSTFTPTPTTFYLNVRIPPSLARSSPLFVKETFPVFIFNHSASTKFPVAIMARRPQRLKKILRVYLEFCVDIRNVTA